MTSQFRTLLEGEYFAIWKATFRKQLLKKYKETLDAGLPNRGFTCFCIAVYEDCPEVIDYSQN